MLNFDAFELVNEVPPRKYAYDMVWVDEWRGDRVRSRLCVRQFKAEGIRNDLFAGTPDTFFIKYVLEKAASCKQFGVEGAISHQEFHILETERSSEWNKESFKAVARVLI